MEKYVVPEMEIIKFETEDIMTASEQSMSTQSFNEPNA